MWKLPLVSSAALALAVLGCSQPPHAPRSMPLQEAGLSKQAPLRYKVQGDHRDFCECRASGGGLVSSATATASFGFAALGRGGRRILSTEPRGSLTVVDRGLGNVYQGVVEEVFCEQFFPSDHHGKPGRSGAIWFSGTLRGGGSFEASVNDHQFVEANHADAPIFRFSAVPDASSSLPPYTVDGPVTKGNVVFSERCDSGPAL